MKEFSGSILTSLEALFLQFNFRRLLFWVFIFVGIVALVSIAEGATGYIFFFKMERKISLLKSLNDLSQNGVGVSTELSPIYAEIVAELKSYQIEPISVTQLGSALIAFPSQLPDWLWKFTTGGLLGFLVGLSGLFERKKGNPQWSSMTLGGVFFGLVAGLIGIFIPILFHPLVNYIGYPILQIIGILLISRKKN